MTSIQIDDGTAKALAAIATARRMTVEEYLRTLVASDGALLANHSAAEFDRDLEPLLFDGPALPADFSRADIYADHDCRKFLHVVRFICRLGAPDFGHDSPKKQPFD